MPNGRGRDGGFAQNRIASLPSTMTVSVPPTLFMLLTASATGSSSSSTPFPPSVTSHRNYFLLFPITETTTSLTLRLLPSYNSHIANAQRRRRYGNVRSIHDIRGGAVGDDGTGSLTYPPGVGGYDTNNSDGPAQAIPPSPPQLSSLLQSQHQQQYDHIMTEGPGNNTNNHHQNTYSQISSSSEEYGNNNNNNNYYISDADPMLYEYRETVEARIDAWRRQQHQMQQSQSSVVDDASSSPHVDEYGRFKLFTTVSRISVSFFFFILMWRTVHHYELADLTFSSAATGGGGDGKSSPILRIIVVTPLVVLFIGEMMGAILGLTGGLGIGGGSNDNASHATKKRLKGILNLHKGVELSMIIYNVIRLAIWPSRYVIREVYIGRTIANFFFLMQCQLYTKLSWDDVSKSTIGDKVYAAESYYDDYPDMAMGNIY